MNREILFRGQTRKFGEKVRMNGEKLPGNWVYGGIFHGTGDHSIIYGCKSNVEQIGGILEKYPVYSDTVGEYTGLADKNGVKIFEGDIVACDGYDGYAEIKWCEYTARFIIEHDEFIADFDNFDNIDCKVVGNIHDNPELLEGGGEK